MKSKWYKLSLSLLATLSLYTGQNAYAMNYETYLESWDAGWHDVVKYLPHGPGGTNAKSYEGVTLNIGFGCYSFPGLNGLQFSSTDVSTVVSFVQEHGGKARISFGGASYAAPCAPNYFISQTAGWPRNYASLAKGVLATLALYNLNGVDFDIEDPLPTNVTAKDFATDLIRFLKTVRKGLPKGKTLSITIPAQGWGTYWYDLATGVAAIPGLVDYINFMEYDIWVNSQLSYAEQIQADILTYTSCPSDSPAPNYAPGWGIPAELIQLGLMPGCDDVQHYLSVQDAKDLAAYAKKQKLYGVMTWDLDRDSGKVHTPSCSKYPYSYLYTQGVRNVFGIDEVGADAAQSTNCSR